MAFRKSTKTSSTGSELAAGEFDMTQNRKSDRPRRKRTRQSSTDSPFVDSALAVSDPDESEMSDEADSVVVSRRKRQRPSSRASTPPLDTPSELSDDEAEMTDTAETFHHWTASLSPPANSSSENANVTSQTLPLSLNITINVPPGHTGPIHMQLDVPSASVPKLSGPSSHATQNNQKPQHSPQPRQTPSTAPSSSSTSTSHSLDPTRAGFLDLPSEIRNTIYELVFTAPKPLHFSHPTHFPLSAAFLRTCRQVHAEGRTVLYMANTFVLDRRRARAGSYWQAEWREAGFKPVRRFLQMIGAENTALLRQVALHCDDATPCLNPDLRSADSRRFTSDEVLVACLRHLARYSRLRTLELNFNGRRRLDRGDAAFLDQLTQLRADKVAFVAIGGTGWAFPSKHARIVEEMCLARMVRRRKMYP